MSDNGRAGFPDADYEPPEDNIDFYGEMQEPYMIEEDTGYGTCPECGSYLYNGGAVSDGDGDLYDELICPLCQEQRGRANEHWFDDEGNSFDSYDDMTAFGQFDEDDEDV